MASFLEEEVVDGTYISHAAAIRDEPQFQLTAGADVDEGQRARFRDRWSVSALFESAQEMLRTERPEVVCVCSPTERHMENCLSAIEAGCRAIFCEKPVASRLDEADAVVRACEERNIILAINHTRRWTPNFNTARELLLAGRLGKIQSAVAHYGGGVGNIGTHLFDLLRFLFGEAEAVTALADWNSDGDPDISGYLEFAAGFGCHIVANDTRAHYFFEIDVIGAEGRLRICRNGQALELYGLEPSPSFAYAQELSRQPEFFESRDRTPSLRLAYRELASILNGVGPARPACAGADGIAAMDIACGLMLSARHGRERICLPLNARHEKLPSRQRGNAVSASTH